MRLNKSTNHAIRILIECANAGDQLTKVADLSVRADTTPQNTFKIVHLLSRAGFLEAVRGRYGGVRLAKSATDIRIGNVVREIEAGIDQDRAKATGSDRDFNLLIDDAFSAFLQVLDGQTLADMARAQSKKSRTNAKRKSIAKLARPTTTNRAKSSAKRGVSPRA